MTRPETGEPADIAEDDLDHARFWQLTREALAKHPGAELEDHDIFASSLKDGLDRE